MSEAEEPFRKIQKRGDNVKIVVVPGRGIEYVCPYPPEHFPDDVRATREELTGKERIPDINQK
jgi:hypothetical protein